MNEEKKTSQEEGHSPVDGMPWAEMMSQMCGEREGCCASMIEKMMGQREQGGFMEMMSQMMSSFAGTKGTTEEKVAAEDAEKA